MPISFKCRCGKELEASDLSVGKRVRCPDCHEALIVPEHSIDYSERPDLEPEKTERECPGCLKIYPEDAVICTDCGINLITGEVIDTGTGKSERNLKMTLLIWFAVFSGALLILIFIYILFLS